MPAALFRCDGGPDLGMGHVMRCRALAAEFEALGWSCAFAVTEITAPLLQGVRAVVVSPGLQGAREVVKAQAYDCLVVDHYDLDAAFETAARGKASAVLAIDDLANRPHDCDILLDPNPCHTRADYAAFVRCGTELLLGPEYVLLRREFADCRPAREQPTARQATRLLITFGGADPSNMSERVLRALPCLGATPLRATLIVGPANIHGDKLTSLAHEVGADVLVNPPDLASLMLEADLAITSASTSAWEFACMGVPALLMVTAENQRATARALERAGAATLAGENLDPPRLAAAIASLAQDGASRGRMSAAGHKLVDGRGAARVAAAVVERLAAKQQETRS